MTVKTNGMKINSGKVAVSICMFALVSAMTTVGVFADGEFTNYKYESSVDSFEQRQLERDRELNQMGEALLNLDIEAPAVEAIQVEVLAAPSVNEVQNNSNTVSGSTEAGATVTVTNALSLVLGTATADADGAFNVVIDPQATGTELNVYVFNEKGQKSDVAKVVVSVANPTCIAPVAEPAIEAVKIEATPAPVVAQPEAAPAEAVSEAAQPEAAPAEAASEVAQPESAPAEAAPEVAQPEAAPGEVASEVAQPEVAPAEAASEVAQPEAAPAEAVSEAAPAALAPASEATQPEAAPAVEAVDSLATTTVEEKTTDTPAAIE